MRLRPDLRGKGLKGEGLTVSEIGRVAPDARRGDDLMAKAAQNVILSPSRDIPFDRLVLSQSNVRRIKSGVSVEELAEDIARRGLLQSLNVRPMLDEAGPETGRFEIPAGGRRFQALSLLVKQKRLVKTAPIPCIVRGRAPRSSPKTTRWPRTCSVWPCTRSTNSAPSLPCAKKVLAMRPLRQPSS